MRTMLILFLLLFFLGCDNSNNSKSNNKKNNDQTVKVVEKDTTKKSDKEMPGNKTSKLAEIEKASPELEHSSNIIHKKEEYPGFTYLNEQTYSNGQSYTVKEYRHEQTGIEFVAIPAGEFMMGSDSGNDDEKPVHKVRLSGFLIAKTEVTQDVWQKIMNTTPWRGQEYVKEGGNFATSYVSWDDCQIFCQKTGLSLPTEAQWEYACRSGNSDTYYRNNSMNGDYVWSYDNTRAKGEAYPHEVGQKKTNAFGLHDMSGNVWEWCADWYDGSYYKNSPMDNPNNVSENFGRVYRGGCWNDFNVYCRSTLRNYNSPEEARGDVGFRLVYN